MRQRVKVFQNGHNGHRFFIVQFVVWFCLLQVCAMFFFCRSLFSLCTYTEAIISYQRLVELQIIRSNEPIYVVVIERTVIGILAMLCLTLGNCWSSIHWTIIGWRTKSSRKIMLTKRIRNSWAQARASMGFKWRPQCYTCDNAADKCFASVWPKCTAAWYQSTQWDFNHVGCPLAPFECVRFNWCGIVVRKHSMTQRFRLSFYYWIKCLATMRPNTDNFSY